MKAYEDGRLNIEQIHHGSEYRSVMNMIHWKKFGAVLGLSASSLLFVSGAFAIPFGYFDHAVYFGPGTGNTQNPSIIIQNGTSGVIDDHMTISWDDRLHAYYNGSTNSSFLADWEVSITHLGMLSLIHI